MAPMEASVYLPPLDGCLDGGKQILSWRLACSGLEEARASPTKAALQRFFQDPRTFETMVHSLEIPQKQKASMRSDFDTYTSAINVSPNGNGSYNVNQMKDDALWLAQNLGIDEVTALRIVVLEWQTRSKIQLREHSSQDGSLGLPAALRLRSSLLRSTHTSSLLHNGSDEARPDKARRLSLLRTWCEERQFQFKCLEQVILRTMEDVRAVADGKRKDDSNPWSEIGPKLIKTWDSVGTLAGQGQNWLGQTVAYLGHTAQQLSGNGGILQNDVDYEDFQPLWFETKGTEVAYALHVTSTILQSSKTLSTPGDFGAWFHLMGEVNFFVGFSIPFLGEDSVVPYCLRSLSMFATLALIDIPVGIETLAEISGTQMAAEDVQGPTYLHSGKFMAEATQVILETLQTDDNTVKPVGLAWSILLQEARERMQHAQDSRDHRLEQRAYDSLGQSQLSDSDSNENVPSKPRPGPNRRTSFGSDTSHSQGLLEYNLECVRKVYEQDDVINLIANASLHDAGAFVEMSSLAADFCPLFCVSHRDGSDPRMRFLLLQVVEAALSYVQYGADLISTTLTLLTGGQTYSKERGFRSHEQLDVASRFLESRAFMKCVFDEASSRFPYESIPFIELCSALTSARSANSEDSFILSILQQFKTFTSKVYEEDTRYELLEDDPFYIELLSPLHFSLTNSVSERGRQLALPANVPFGSPPQKQALLTLPAGTRGLTLSDQKPMVVRFDFAQPGLPYLGRMIQQAANTYSSVESRDLEKVLEPAARIIELLTRLLSISKASDPASRKNFAEEMHILEGFSDNLDRNADIVSVILEIFEGELYEQHSISGGLPTETLSICSRFLEALLPLQPARVWPFLSRSSLLGIDGTESRFSAVVTSQELPLGRYPFLISCLHLFESLIDDVVTRSVAKDSHSTATRFNTDGTLNSSAGIRDTQVTKILHACSKQIVDCFESSRKWKSAANHEDKMMIQEILCRSMNKILSYCFDADDTSELHEKLPSVLSTSVQYLHDVFLSRSKSEVPIDPFTQILYDSLQIIDHPLLMRVTKFSTRQTTSTISLATTLVRLNAYLNQPPCRLEEQLFECSELLARSFAVHDCFRLPIMKLLLSMMSGSSRTMEQPPSLLGHLGQQPAKWLLNVLSALDGSLPDPEYTVTVWKFVSAVISQRQQWFALYLLTGKTARSNLRELGQKSATASRNRSLLDVAIEKLCRVDLINTREAAAMLEFVALAADFWLWIPERLQENDTFVKEMVRVLEELDQKVYDRHLITEETQIMDTQMGASIANIFAMIIHRDSEKNDTTFAKRLCPHLGFFVRSAVTATSYNLSLHRSLQRNFEARYPKCRLSNFKRTTLRTVPLGRSFFYDLELANKILSFDKAWARQDGKGFSHEFERANINLSLVQTQINLFHAWKSLAIEVALVLGTHEIVQGYMAKVIIACLQTNQEAVLPEGVFGKLAQSRADLAFVLLQRLNAVSRASADAKSILVPAWNTLRGQASDLGQALSGDEAEYNRSLVRIVYLALQAYLPSAEPSTDATRGAKGQFSDPNFVSLVLDILGTCVARGFRSIISLLHEDPSKVVPTDLSLLTAILRTCLCIPNIDRQTEQLVSHFADSQTARYASTLFSWADQLLINGDPIYGELSIEFLVELSSVSALAESMVLSGILSQISASNLSNHFSRPGGSGPFSQPPRIHVIWSRGILPLVINLLRAIGPPIAGDVTAFLDQFKPQLERAGQCLDPKPSRTRSGARDGHVTLNEASEVHSLAILVFVLDALREAGPSVGIGPNEVPRLALDVGVLRNDLETRLQRRGVLREDIVPVDEREENWAREDPVKDDTRSESLLEQKIVLELRQAFAVLGNED